MQISGYSASVVRDHGYHAKLLERSNAALARVEEITAQIERRKVVSAATRLREDVLEFRLQVQQTRPVLRTSQAGAIAQAAPVNFDTSTAAATMISTEQINTDATAFNPDAPAWAGLSTAQPTAAGVYDASLGTTTITGTVTRQGVHTVSHARVELTDNNSGWSERFNINRNNPVDQVYTTDIGLDFTFSLGAFLDDDTFTIDLQTGLQVEPDPDGSFDQSGGTDANLELGQSVTAGSFTINGELISVDADDSINAVLAKINASDAGVNAVYNPATEGVDITQLTVGEAPTIALANDTSGFLAAVKLDTAVVTPGKDSDLDRPIGDLAAFAGVSSGSLLINENPIAIDTTTDSIVEIIDNINQANIGVTASLEGGNTLTIRSSNSNGFTLDSNGTNFFETLSIDPGTFGIAQQSVRSSPSDITLYRITHEANALVTRLNRFFSNPVSAVVEPEVTSLRDQIGTLFEQELGGVFTGLNLRTGLQYDAGNPRQQFFSEFHDSELRRGLRWQFSAVKSALTTFNQDGFLDKVVQLLDETLLAPKPVGSLIDEVV